VGGLAIRAAAEVGANATPHSPQNLNWGGFSKPQLAHRWRSGAAQLPQNFVPAGFSASQFVHRIVMNLPRHARTA
jgi:hypothetical protein